MRVCYKNMFVWEFFPYIMYYVNINKNVFLFLCFFVFVFLFVCCCFFVCLFVFVLFFLCVFFVFFFFFFFFFFILYVRHIGGESRHIKWTLTLSTLLTNSADDKLMILLLSFPENRILHFMQIVSKEALFIKCLIVISVKSKKKNILKCRLLEFLPSMLSARHAWTMQPPKD